MADKKISALTGATTPLAGSEVLPIVQSGSTVKVSVDNLTAGKTVNTGDVISVKTSAGAVTDVVTVQNLSSSAGTEAGIFFSPTAATGNIRGARITGINDGGNVIGLKFYTGTGAAITSKFEMTADGNLAVSTAGKGIDFSANTHAAGMTSELLNDYEEGTWTPIITDGVNDATMGSGPALYTKIGRLVTVQGYIYTTSLGSVTGDLKIKGLPFASIGGAGDFMAAAVGFGDSLAITAGQSVGIRISPGTTTALLVLWDAATGSTAMQDTEWTANGEIMFSFSYMAA